MQTAKQLEDVTNLHVSSYELITKWLDIGYTLGLSSNALQLMTMLLRFYNPKKKFVFPLQETLATRMNASVTTVKRGLNELLRANLILKRRTQRGNIYGFTGALFELLNSSNKTISTGQNEPCMNHEQNKRNKIKEHHHKKKTIGNMASVDDDFSSKSSKKRHITLNEVPAIIRNNLNIKNPCGYWASLTEEEKQEQLKQNVELERKKLVSLENKRKAKELQLQLQEQKKKELEELEKPLNERWTKDGAIKHIRMLGKINKRLAYGEMCRALAEAHGLNIEMLLQKD